MASSVCPMIMFDGVAERAMNFYTSLFPDSRIDAIERYGAGEIGPEGTVKRAAFTVAGLRVACIDSPIKHAFGLTPSVSLLVECASEAEVEAAFAALAEGGMVLMPLDRYDFSRRFGWVTDRFGLSWQLNLA